MGRKLRNDVPRASHREWAAPADRPDPLELLEAQGKSRLQALLPIRYGRMVASPFGFLRGAVAVMAADLSRTPASGIDSVLCGDAHLSNFGLFASPERSLVFDLNDFDEAYQGPWEWDLKRLAISSVVAAIQNGVGDKDAEQVGVVIARTYREAMRKFSEMPVMDVWYFQVKAEEILTELEKHPSKDSELAGKIVKKALGKTEQTTVARLTEIAEGRRRFVSQPPLMVRLDDLDIVQQAGRSFERQVLEKSWRDYLDSLPEEIRPLLERFRITDAALRVVGVGSVGTRCGIVLLEGGGGEDALILQLKEAVQSVLAAYLPGREYINPAYRVVVSQRLLQTASDIFLGWQKGVLQPGYYYWRQLKDMKGSVPIETLDYRGLCAYVELCSLCLARAHARTSDPSEISGYLGTGEEFDEAVGGFALAYAGQNERDYQKLVKAVKKGKIEAQTGI